MSLEFEIPLVSLIFIAILNIVYFSKQKIFLPENKMYEVILICSFIETFIDTIIHFICSVNSFADIKLIYFPLFNLLNKILSTLFVIIFASLFCYTVMITYEKIKNNVKKILNPLIIIETIFGFIMLFTDIELVKVGNVTNVAGLTIILGYIFVAIFLFATLVVALINIRRLDKRYMVIFLILFVMGILYAITIIFPGMIIYDLILAIMCYIMYFTIENPDVKMINQLESAKDQAEKANHAKTDFLSSISHEIRTPLNAIVGFSESIEKAKTLEEAKENSKDIIDASHTLLDIVNGILDISKIESGKLEIINSPYDAKEVFESLGKLIRPRIEEKGIEFNVDIAEDLPPVLYGDYANVKKVVTNLLTNAAKYTDSGKIVYRVACVVNKDICRLIIAVEDTGRGIKKESIDKLFTKFERLDEKNTTIEGTGLGLAITKQIVELMGGEIVVQSIYGSGSKFTVAINQRVEKVSLKSVQKEELTTALDLTGKKILVVDDNKLNLKVASKVLGEYNATLELIDSGMLAIEKIQNREFYDLILMDDMMPKLSGVETLRKLKEIEGFNIPTVALTANAISGMREKYISEGFDDYLSKPINRMELEKVLGNILNKGSIMEERFEPLPEELYEMDKTLTDIKIDCYKLNNNVDNMGIKIDSEKIENNVEEVKESGNEGFASKTEILTSNGVDLKGALELLGDIEMYNETFKGFIDEISNKLDKLEEYKNMENMEDYRILVHSLKSDAKYLGFKDLADKSYEHEMKSKENNISYIKNDFENLKSMIENIIKISKEYFK